MVNLVVAPSSLSFSSPSDPGGGGGGTLMRLLSTFSETTTGMEFMVRERLKRRRSPDFLTGAADAAAAGGLGWAEVVTLVADDVDVEESLLKTRGQSVAL